MPKQLQRKEYKSGEEGFVLTNLRADYEYHCDQINILLE